MDNGSRIEKAVAHLVGATLTAAEITHLVRKAHPEWLGGVYPQDCAYAKDAQGNFVFRGKQAYNDGVLWYKGTDAFVVLAPEQIVRRAKRAGRGSNIPLAPETIEANIAKKLAALQPAPPAPPASGKGGKQDSQSAR